MNKDKKYYEGLDKRGKEYKAYARFNKLGNDIPVYEAKFVEGSDIKIAFTDKPLQGHEFMVIEDKVKEIEQNLEAAVWKKEPKDILRPFTREHYEAYKKYKEKRTLDVWGVKSIDMLVNLYAHVFALQHNKAELTKESKGSFKKLATMSKELDEVFESYKRLNK